MPPEPAPSPVTRRRPDRIGAAFHAAGVRALRIAFFMRLGALGAVGAWLSYLLGFPAVLYFIGIFAGFILLSYAQYNAGKRGAEALLYGLILADFLLLAFATLTDNPLTPGDYPPGQKISQARSAYFYILLAGVAACYQPARVLWAGASAIAAWTLGFFWLASQPDAVTIFDTGNAPSLDAWMALTANPYFVDFNRLIETLVVFTIVTAILSAVAWHARRMVRAQIAISQERANLSRYFAPGMVEELAKRATPFDGVNGQSAAVLFADVVGFTTLFQDQPPEQTISFLRSLHRRMEQAIFQNAGTLDKFMGDGVMAIFGVPHAAPDDACRAIAAALDMQAAVASWNDARSAAGYPTVRLAVGVHYGPVVTGDIGSERRLEFATIGDAVNLASRLESATRRLDAQIVISAETAARARQEDPPRAAALLASFRPHPTLPIPGHAAVDVLTLPV